MNPHLINEVFNEIWLAAVTVGLIASGMLNL